MKVTLSFTDYVDFSQERKELEDKGIAYESVCNKRIGVFQLTMNEEAAKEGE